MILQRLILEWYYKFASSKNKGCCPTEVKLSDLRFKNDRYIPYRVCQKLLKSNILNRFYDFLEIVFDDIFL